MCAIGALWRTLQCAVQIDDQVHEYGRNTDTMHGLPECVSVYGIKSRLQVCSAILFLSCHRYLHGQSVHDRIAEGMHEGDMFEKKLHDFYYYVALSI